MDSPHSGSRQSEAGKKLVPIVIGEDRKIHHGQLPMRY